MKYIIVLLLIAQNSFGQVVNQLQSSLSDPSSSALNFYGVDYDAGKFYLMAINVPTLETPVITSGASNWEIIDSVDYYNFPYEWRMVVYRFYATTTFEDTVTATFSTGVPNKRGNIVQVSQIGVSENNGLDLIISSSNNAYEGTEELLANLPETGRVNVAFIGNNVNPASLTPATGWNEVYDNGAGAVGNGSPGSSISYSNKLTFNTTIGTIPSGRYSGVIVLALGERRVMFTQ